MRNPTGRPRIADYDELGKNCLYCGKVFYLRDKPFLSFANFKKRKFCSVLCADKARGASTTSEGFNHEAFWNRTKLNENGCMVWTGSFTPKGYGRLIVNRRHVLSHRIAYELANGPIPDDMMVLHSCDNPACCNPKHLRLGTAKDNWADAICRNRLSPNQIERFSINHYSRAGRA